MPHNMDTNRKSGTSHDKDGKAAVDKTATPPPADKMVETPVAPKSAPPRTATWDRTVKKS